MNPSEVIAMRDKLAGELEEEYAVAGNDIADWLIESGWVTSEPSGNPGEFDYQYACGRKEIQG